MAWKRGQSGNPQGRPRGQSLREALRRRLVEADPDAPARSRFERWAEEIVDAAIDLEARLAVIRFLEGPHPMGPPPSDDEIEAKPRIAIPGSPGHARRPKAKGRARTRKPPA